MGRNLRWSLIPASEELPPVSDSIHQMTSRYIHLERAHAQSSAFSSALYHPPAWPRYVATSAPTIPSTVVQMKPVGSYLVAGIDEFRDHARDEPNDRPEKMHRALHQMDAHCAPERRNFSRI